MCYQLEKGIRSGGKVLVLMILQLNTEPTTRAFQSWKVEQTQLATTQIYVANVTCS